jgi:guanylate kinase
VSGRSAIGKTAIAAATGLKVLVTHTSRQIREGEVDGAAYHFRMREWFEDNLDRFTMDLVQFDGNYYGAADSDLADSDIIVMTFDKALEFKKKGMPVFLVWVVGEARRERRGRDLADDDRLEALFEENREWVDMVLVNDGTIEDAAGRIMAYI